MNQERAKEDKGTTAGRLAGKIALVTGAGSGIGRASAELFAREGARVLAADKVREGIEETVRSVTSMGGQATAAAGDAGDDSAVRAWIEQCLEWGGLDVIYANAGITGPRKTLFEIEADEWADVVRVNLVGPFLAIRHGGQAMAERGGGSIVCTASVAALRSGAGGTPYSATKAGVVSLVQTAANQLSGTNVRVNAICPGLVETGMTKPTFERARERGTEKKIGQLNPLRRAGQPEEIAQLALFLASDEASYVNGQAIAACGGLSSSHPFIPGRLS